MVMGAVDALTGAFLLPGPAHGTVSVSQMIRVRPRTVRHRWHLPPAYRRFQFFICGPDPMMDAAEAALVKLGVPAERVHTERFDMA